MQIRGNFRIKEELKEIRQLIAVLEAREQKLLKTLPKIGRQCLDCAKPIDHLHGRSVRCITCQRDRRRAVSREHYRRKINEETS